MDLADYAKLVRKRDKAVADGQTPTVDLAMLRASTAARAAEGSGTERDREASPARKRSSSPGFPPGHAQPSQSSGPQQQQQQQQAQAYPAAGPLSKTTSPASGSASAYAQYPGPGSGSYPLVSGEGAGQQQPQHHSAPPPQYQAMPPPPSAAHRGPSHLPGHPHPPPPPWAAASSAPAPLGGRASYGSLSDSREYGYGRSVDAHPGARSPPR
jgi:hypothetical protein